MKTTSFLYAAMLAALAAACSINDDTFGPEITLWRPAHEDAFTRGGRIAIEFDLDDPAGVNTYKIDIHYAGGEHVHTHALSVAPAEEVPEEPWNYLIIYDDKRGQTSPQVTLSVKVPNNAQEGEYHLGILATDLFGNESQVYIDFDIID
jgi:hypothetical protein